MKKYSIILLLTLIILSALSIINNSQINQLKIYESNLFYMDTYINIKIWHNNNQEATQILSEIDQIYNHYHQLSDRYNPYPNRINLYTIANNTSQEEYLTIEQDLYDLLVYGKEWYQKSKGLLNINLGNVIDVWKKYREADFGIPTIEELQNSGSTNIEEIVLANNTIKNTHPNIDLGSISKGYATKKVGEYLQAKNIKHYLINAGGNVLVGEKYPNKKFNIGIENPNPEGGIFKTIQGNNIAVITSGGYERNYIYNNTLYHHIINPNTYMPENHMKSVTVITQDSSLGDALSTILFLMTIEEGQAYLKSFPNVQAIWYTNDDQIITTKGISKYE